MNFFGKMPRRSFILMTMLGGWIASPGAASAGWDAGLDLTLEGAASLTGGNRRGTTLHGLALGRAAWSQAKEAQPGPAFSVYGSVLAHAGHGPTERLAGDFLAVSNMEAYSSFRLYTWWLETKRRGWNLRGGALLADEEFAGTEGGGNFINSAFGWPAFISANTVNTGPAFYIPALALRLERTWEEAGVWRIGIYDGDTFDSPDGDPRVNRHGVRFHSNGDQGWFVITEVTWSPEGRLFRLKAGAWLHTAAFNDARDDETGRPFALTGAVPREHASNYGAYVAVERELAGGGQVFLRGGMSPTDRNTLSWALDAGLSWTGLWPRRPADVAFLGIAHIGFGSHYAGNALAADPTAPAPDFEQVVEAGYTFALSERWSLQPDLQYVRHPGGNSARRDAMIFMLRTSVSY